MPTLPAKGLVKATGPTVPAATQPRGTAPTGMMNPPAQGGFDLSGPSAAESAYGQYAGQLGQKGATENYVAQHAGQLNSPGRAESYASNPQAYGQAAGSTASAGAYGQAQPALSGQSAQERFAATADPSQQTNATAAGQYWNSLQGGANLPARDMSAYYDRARETGAAGLDKAAAARGMFGSTAALDQQRQLQSDIGGQQARDEAQYGLDRAGLSDQIMGGASSRADSAGLGRFNSLLGAAGGSDAGLLGRIGQLGNMAGGVDSAGLGKYLGEFGVAQGGDAGQISRFNTGLAGRQASDNQLQGRLGLVGQGAALSDAGRTGRIGMFADQLGNLTAGATGLVGKAHDGMLNTDQGYMDMASQLGLGAGAQNLQSAIGNTAAVGAQGATMTAAGAGADQNAASIYGLISGAGKKPAAPAAGG
jgi:hypothetical protein